MLVEPILEVRRRPEALGSCVSSPLLPQQSGIRAEVQFVLKFQSKVCFGLSAVCLC